MSIKSTIAAAAASPFLLAGAAFAGPYVNVETVQSYSGDDYTGLSTELQIGYEGENWYVSGGPIVDSPDNGESSTDFIGYVGCLLYTSPSPRDKRQSRMPSSA